MPYEKIMFRVILSSPSDLPSERRVVHDVISEINCINKSERYGLLLFAWENDVPPRLSLDNGQHEIDDVFQYEESDLLIGIFHQKLGTPTLEAESGSVHEINRAIESYKERKAPEIKLYFKKVRIMLQDTSAEMRKEYERLMAKKNEYMKLGIVKEFSTTKEFEKECRININQWFNKSIEQIRQPSSMRDIINVKSRYQFERIEEIIAKAEKDVLVLGINLDGIVNMIEQFQLKERSELNVRLLALNPFGASIEGFIDNGIDIECRKSKIISNLHILNNKLGSCKNIDIRVIDRFFTAGCIALDMQSTKGRIIAQQYLNNVGTADAPTLDIRRENPLYFETYRHYLETLWRDSIACHSILRG